MRTSLIASEIAEPYAQALMSLAQSNNLTDQIGDDISSLLALLSASPEFNNCLQNPIIKRDTKKAIIGQALGEQVHPYVLNFLYVLVDRGRILFLDSICKQFQVLLRQLNQSVLAEVTTAVELNEEQCDRIRQKVLNLTGARQVDLDVRLDPDLIGGVIIKVGSQVIDASLRGQIRRIGLRLSAS